MDEIVVKGADEKFCSECEAMMRRRNETADRTMKSIVVVIFLLCLAVFMVEPALARTPLLVEGKSPQSQIYQRIITHPGASLMSAPGPGMGEVTPAFMPFYVFDRRNVAGEEWLEVAPGEKGDNPRWIRGTDCSRWDKALTLMFTDRMGRRPVLFFKSKIDLERLAEADDIPAYWDATLTGYERNPAQSPLVDTEDRQAAVPRDNFYLTPVFDFSDEYRNHGFTLLKIGCVPSALPVPAVAKPAPVAAAQPSPTVPTAPPAAPAMKAGIAFIVDTTLSMGPYIEKTKQFISHTFDKLAQSPRGQDISLALVAYRNSTNFNPRLEYVAHVVSDFTPYSERSQLETNFSRFGEATVSTHSFDEDAFGGISKAIDKLDWSPYPWKMAVLVSDSGAIRANDRYSSTGLNEDEVRDLLAKKNIRLLVISLRTKAGEKHHPKERERQLTTLTSTSDGRIKSAYVPINAEASGVAQYDKLATQIISIVQRSMEKEEHELAAKVPPPPPPSPPVEEKAPERQVETIVSGFARAAGAEYAGQVRDVRAPKMVEAWTVDMDLADLIQGKPTMSLQVAVLLTRAQLENLYRSVQAIVEQGRKTRETNSDKFFNGLVSLAAQTVVDPMDERARPGVSPGEKKTIAELGLLPAFLEGLPYKSLVMSMSLDNWMAMNGEQQDDFLSKLDSKLKVYLQYYADTANWKSFGSSDPADAMYRVPLTSLP